MELDENISLADEGMLTLDKTKKIFQETNGKMRNLLPENSVHYLKYDSLMSKRTAWWTEDEHTGKYISKGGSNYQNLIYLQEAIEEVLKKIKVIENITNNNQDSSKIEENNKGPNIFLSYCHKDKEITDRVDKFFISKSIPLTRDVRDSSPYSSLKKFMDTIRDHDYVILLISDAYLKSINCMYEVIQFIQERNYIDRTFPIVIDNEATIFDQSKHSKYIHYWQTKYKELGDEIKILQNTGTISLHRELDKINRIQSNIGEFLNKIADLKCFSLDELESTNYKAILDKIGKTLGVFQKEETDKDVEELLKKRIEREEKDRSKRLEENRKETKKKNFLKRVRYQTVKSIINPLEEKMNEFNRRYHNEGIKFGEKEIPVLGKFVYIIKFISGKDIQICIDGLYDYKFEYQVSPKSLIDIPFPTKENLIKKVTPELKGRKILAWGFLKTSEDKGFNLFLVEKENDIYVEWLILENRNHALSLRKRLPEPFPFEIQEFQTELPHINVNASHIYSRKIIKLDIKYIFNFFIELI